MNTVIYLENALCPVDRRIEQRAGSVRELAPQDWAHPFVAFVDGRAIVRADWDLVLEDDQVLAFIDVAAIPQGGGGGGSDPLRTVLMLAVIYYTGGLGGAMLGIEGAAAVGGLGVAMANAAVVMVGMALVNAILPPPKPTSPQQAAALAAPSPTYNLQAQGNTARVDAAIPEGFGRLDAFPDYAAQPYQEFAGNEQYLYSLLCLGRGEYSIESILIETTPITSFDEVTYEVVAPNGSVTLFPTNVTSSTLVAGQSLTCIAGTYSQTGTTVTVTAVAHGLAIGKVLYVQVGTGSLVTGSYTIATVPTLDTFTYVASTSLSTSGNVNYSPWVGGFIANESGTTANYIGVDFAATKGLYYANDDGSLGTVGTNIRVEARTVDAVGAPLTAFVQIGTTFNYSGATTTPQRYSQRIGPLTFARYEIRVCRIDLEGLTTRYGHAMVWAGLRGYLQDTRTYGDVTLIAIRMRATNNLTAQASRKINVIATRKLPIWNGSTWSANTATRSIAWAIVYACKQIGMTDSQIDLAGLLTLDSTWTGRGDYFDGRFDNFLSFWESITKIAITGRSKPYMQGGVLRVKRDQAQTIPVALFSTRNIVRGSFSIDYLMPTYDTADSVDVTYFDSTTWNSAKVRATLTGSTTNQPAKIDLFGVTSRAQAYREGIYQAASNVYRRRIVKFSTEMEGFIPSFGDLIAIQHDMPAWGQGGEVTAWNSGTLTLTLSEPVTFGSGTNYIGLRKRDGSVDGPYAVTAGGSANQVVFASAPASTPYTGMNEERTHFTFGAGATWTQFAIVTSAKPKDLYTIDMVAVVENSNVHTAESGLITPTLVTSQLAGYTNTPVVGSVTARFLFNYPNQAVASWQPAPWADHYYVEISNGDGVWNRIGDTAANSFSFTATYGKTTLVRVAGVGLGRGPWAQSTVLSVLPFDPGAVTYTTELNGIRLKWPARLEIDTYEVRVDGTSWATSTLVADVTGTEYLWKIQTAASRTIRIKSLDVNGNYSANESDVVVVIGGPSAPALTYLITGTDELLSWAIPASGFMVDRYEIRYGATWAAGTFVDTTKATSYRRKADYSGARTYWVAAIDVAGNYGSPSSIGVTLIASGAVVGLYANVIDNNALIYWSAPTTGSLPFTSYEVRKGTTWAAGTLIGSNGNSTFCTTFEQQSGTYTYWVAAVDSAGTYGTPQSVAAAINQPPDYVLRANINSIFAVSGVTVTSTKTNALAYQGGLLLPVNTTETWTQHFVNNSFATPQAQITAGDPLYVSPASGGASYTEVYDYGVSVPTTSIVATLNSTLLSGTVGISCQIQWSNTSVTGPWTSATAGATSAVASNFRWVQVTYTFTAAAGPNLLQVTALNVKLSIKNRNDSGSGTASVGGTAVTFGYPFISADCPIVQPSFTSGAAPRFPVVTYVGGVNPTGFTVQIFNAAGTDVGGAFSWTCRGY